MKWRLAPRQSKKLRINQCRLSGRLHEMARLALALSVILAVLTASPAFAMQCAPMRMMIPAIERAGERVIWKGIAGGHLAILMQHQTSASWTFVAVSPRKLACIIAHGSDAELRAGAGSAAGTGK